MGSFRAVVSALLLSMMLLLLPGVGPAWARPSARDAASTHAYLVASIAKRRAGIGSVQAAVSAIEALAGQLALECPGVLAGVPRGKEREPGGPPREEISEEVSFAALGADERLAHPAFAHFYREVRGLRWSNRKLTRLLHSLALEADEQSALVPLPLCTDVKFWVASGYTATSAATRSFVKRLHAISSITTIEPEPESEPHAENFLNLEGLVAQRLKRYEDRADRVLARRAFSPQLKATDPRLRPLFAAVGEVYDALGWTPSAQ